MNYAKFNSFKQKQRHRQDLSQTNSWQHKICQTEFQGLLQLLCNTDDLDKLLKIFSTICLCLLRKNIKCEQVLKCDAMYKKLGLVLKSGLQTKSIMALNFIYVLLLFGNESECTKVKALHIYAKNMIRISGCLTTMTEFFTSSMMQHDTLKALCHSISATCDGCFPNQSFCSHLVPLCIERCKRGNMDPLSILQSLLANHQENVILFYECNGMSIFNRESLHNQKCLQLLNIVVENTKPENCDEILKASDLFRELRSYLNRYGRKSTVGKWASVILFSHSKVVQTEIFKEEDEQSFTLQNSKTLHNSYNETTNVTDTLNDTDVLFRNVFREAIGWQNKYGSENRFIHNSNIFQGNYNNNIRECFKMPHSYAEIRKPNVNEKLKCQENIFTFPVATDTEKDLSFSFLLKETPLETRFREPNYSFRSDQKFKEVQMFKNEPFFHESRNHKATDTLMRRNRDAKSVLDFKPRFVSTPKHNKRLNLKTTPRTGTETSTSKTLNNRSKFTNSTFSNKKLRYWSMGSKFLNILNGSCTTLIKRFQSMFTAKKTSANIDDNDKSKDLVSTNMEENIDCAFNFTINNYCNTDNTNTSALKVENDWTTFSREFSLENSNCNSCYTCNDTVVLKHKFENDAFLQQTVNKLKIGINLYGCDFKKISKTIWPREAYMTPNVLYKLYRKLIIKQ